MDKKEQTTEEHFEDASEVVDSLIEEATGVKMSELSVENDSESEDQEKERFEDCEEGDLIDDESQRDFEKDQTDEEREAERLKAEELKKQGNELFKSGEYHKSAEVYTTALRTCPVACVNERSVLYANRAAAKHKLDLKPAAIDDCTKAIEFNPKYLKALLRRATIYEETDKLDESMEDFKKALEIDPKCHEALEAQRRLPPLINERNEKMKAEMIDKLKDLGNMILRPFGLSTKNFELKQDETTGSYSVNFNQGKQE